VQSSHTAFDEERRENTPDHRMKPLDNLKAGCGGASRGADQFISGLQGAVVKA
jgi:hypothetical protein